MTRPLILAALFAGLLAVSCREAKAHPRVAVFRAPVRVFAPRVFFAPRLLSPRVGFVTVAPGVTVAPRLLDPRVTIHSFANPAYVAPSYGFSTFAAPVYQQSFGVQSFAAPAGCGVGVSNLFSY